jgi:tetratricopeptide (TPR) repeat protein
MKLGRFEESIASYERALDVDPNFTPSYVGIANNLMFTGRFDEARAVTARLEAVARTDAERRQVCTWNAASFLYQDDFDAALAEIQRRFDIAAATDDQPTMSGDLNAMGDIMLRMGRFDDAARRYLEAVEMMRGSVATDEIKLQTARNQFYDMARVALWKGDVAAAAEQAIAYRQAVEEHGIPFELRQSSKLDGMVALANGDFEAALEDLTRASDQDPQTWLLRARAYAAAGDLDTAREACAQAINFNQPVYNLALVRNTAVEVMGGF